MQNDGGLRSEFRKRIPDFHWQAVETGGTGKGIPDNNYCARPGIEGWIEFKKSDAWIIQSLKPEQVGWIDKRTRFGGRVWIGVRKFHDGGPRRGPAIDELWMIHGARVLELQEHGLRHDYGRVLSGGPARWDWGYVRECLTR